MRRVFAAILAVLLMATALFCCAETENLVYNADFSIDDGLGGPDGWSGDNYYAGASEFSLIEEADGNRAVCVRAVEEDDARYIQWIEAEPDTFYRISCRLRIDEPIEGGRGANLSILNSSYAFSDSVYDTGGEWRELTMTGKTGPDQYGFYLALRVGGYSATSVGAACFDDIRVEKTTDADFGIAVSLTTYPSVKTEPADEPETGEPVRHTPAILLGTAALLLIALLIVNRADGWRIPENRGRTALIVLLALAFIVRLAVACLVRGYDVDITDFELWGGRMAAQGFGFYGDGSYFCDYPPLYMLLLGAVSAVKDLFAFPFDSLSHQILIKLIPILADLSAAYLIWRFMRKKHSSGITFAVTLLVALNPAAIVDSAAWGQIDQVFMVLIVLSVLLAEDKKPIPALMLFALSVLVKPQPLLFAPLGLVIVIRAVREDSKLWKDALIGTAAAAGVLYVTALPFAVSYCRAAGRSFGVLTPFSWLISLYTGTVSGYSAITVNALNLYTLLDLNWVSTDVCRGWAVFSWVMFAAAYAFAIGALLISKRKKTGCLAGAVLMTLIFAFGPMMHERYLFPAVMLLFFAYADTKDVRVLYAAVVMSVTQFVNMLLVLQGGMVREYASLGHLQLSEQSINAVISLINVLMALYLIYVFADISIRGRTVQNVPRVREKKFAAERQKVTRAEAGAVALITAAYAVLALFNLGSVTAPQSEWTPADGETCVFDLGETKSFRFTYYTGYSLSGFTAALSDDGETWSEEVHAVGNQGEIFRWIRFTPQDGNEKTITVYSKEAAVPDGGIHFTYPEKASDDYPMQTARYIRLTADGSETVLGEAAFLTEDGQILDAVCTEETLLDEQDIVETAPSWYNSTYFDEIYHARTGYEHANGLNTYEWTHPPLGKVFIMFGIKLFGMTPFGWRFSGAVAGIAMLPVLYMMIRTLTGKRDLSFIGMILLALDAMHFTQTRIATVDSYAVLFIMVMYLFMFRYIRDVRDGKPLGRRLAPLALSGVFMGLACASKWIGIYAAAGLGLIFAASLIGRGVEYRGRAGAGQIARLIAAAVSAALLLVFLAGLVLTGDPGVVYVLFGHSGMTEKLAGLLSGKAARVLLIGASALAAAGCAVCVGHMAKKRAGRAGFLYEVAVTGFVCVVSFIIVPALIYFYSYIPQLACEGGPTVRRVIELQKSMFSYHAGLGSDTHYFRSPWYEWPLIVRPMWYYSASPAYLGENMVSSISCMGNPAVWWTGFIATVYSLVRLCVAKKIEKPRLLGAAGFLSQFLPWVLVPRSTFIYHYFAAVPFIIILTVMMLDDLRPRRLSAFTVSVFVLTGIALVLFVMFYPLESGVPADYGYMMHLRWFNWYNFALK